MAATDQGLLSLGPKDGVSSRGLWPSPLRLDRKRLSCVLGAWVINSLPSWPAWRMADSEGVSLSSRSCVAIDQYRNRAGSTAVREWPGCIAAWVNSRHPVQDGAVGSACPEASCCRSFRQHRPGSAMAGFGMELSDRGEYDLKGVPVHGDCSQSRGEPSDNTQRSRNWRATWNCRNGAAYGCPDRRAGSHPVALRRYPQASQSGGPGHLFVVGEAL
jgi:hypothetical protein